MRLASTLVAAALAPAWGQQIKLPPAIERLAEKAEESVDVTLDKSMLQFAGRFLSDKPDEAKAKRILGGLESIYVRSFEFAREGQYNAADLDSVRAQLPAPAWSRVVGVKSMNGENVDVYFKNAAGGQVGGVVVIAAEPRQLTIVSLVGTLDPAQLADLGGQFHIPRLRVNGWREAR